jgi:LysM repeat protein
MLPAISRYNRHMRRKHWSALIFLEIAACLALPVIAYGIFTAPQNENTPAFTTAPTQPAPTIATQSAYVTVEPSPTLAPTVPFAPLPIPTAYVVVSGDTLWDIAVRFDLDIEALIAANPNINPDLLIPGDVVTIPDPNFAPSATPQPLHTAAPPQAQVKADGGGLRLRDGPGLSQPIITMLDAGTALAIAGRTDDNSWLEVITPSGNEGWVMAKFVDVFVALDAVPVTGIVAAAPTGAPGTLAAPPAYPSIANVTDHARQLFLFGGTLGNRPDVFSKVGDSITVSDAFLKPIGWGKYNLREYSNLQPAVDFYSISFARDANSFANTSLAAKVGWPAQALLSPQAADANYCAEGEAPLVCEYRWVRPSVALIMLGTNDVPGTSAARFERHMREVIEISMEMGVVPIVSTLPPMNRAGVEGRVESFNSIITNLAYEYNVPIWDYWSALQGLPDHGLMSDGVHPTLAPNSSDFTPENLQYGMTVRNLTALQALDAVWRFISKQ